MTQRMFSALSLGRRTMRNRILQAPMSVCYADAQGRVTRAMAEHYGRRAQGGVGMVITENIAINASGRQLPQQALISDRSFLPGLTELAAAIKRHGALAVAQIVHAGRYAGPWQEYEARRRLAPSPVAFPLPPDRTVTPDEITREEITETVSAFADATALARQAGFDGVDIHGGQGFLLSSFQSPRTNLRDDEYGGSFEARSRFAVQVVDAVRAAAGEDMLVGYHLLCDELMPGGWDIEDAVRFARRLDTLDVDFVMPIASTFESLRAPHNQGLFDRPGFQQSYALRLANELSTPVFGNGRLWTPDDVEEALAAGGIAAIGLARPLLADPDWVDKVREGRARDVRTCACSPPKCLMTQMTGSVCAAWPEDLQAKGWVGYGDQLTADANLA